MYEAKLRAVGEDALSSIDGVCEDMEVERKIVGTL
jgi:hypothetical protein